MAKQYLLVIEDKDIVEFKRVIPSISFLEVEGMDLAGNPMLKILTTPLTVPIDLAQQFIAPIEETIEQPQAVNE